MRIQAVDAEGVVTEFRSIQAAGRAGYSVQRVHACVHGMAKTHKGHTWRRIDGIHAIPLFVATRLVRARDGQISAEDMVTEFVAWLPESERCINHDAALRLLIERLESYWPRSRQFWGLAFTPSV